MFKKFITAVAVMAASALGTGAMAATPIPLTFTNGTAFFGAQGLKADANSLTSFSFTIPESSLSGTVGTSTTKLKSSTDFDFTSVSIDNHAFDLPSNGKFENVSFSLDDLSAGTHLLNIGGVSRGSGSFGGQLSISAVPEPASWAMMIMGVGAAGGTMRRKRSVGNQALRLA